MKSLVTIATLYLMIGALLLAAGMGIRSLLHWVLPGVDLGTGILTGVLTAGLSAHFLLRVMASVAEFYEASDEEAGGLAHRIYFVAPLRHKRRRKSRGTKG